MVFWPPNFDDAGKSCIMYDDFASRTVWMAIKVIYSIREALPEVLASPGTHSQAHFRAR